MTDKSNFTPDEWKLLLESVMMAGVAVTAAEPSSFWGRRKERLALRSALMKAKVDARACPLIKAVVADFEGVQGRIAAREDLRGKLKGTEPPEIETGCVDMLRQVGEVLDAKAPGDAAAFKDWLLEISRHVAEAAREGGFLGIGSVLVTKAEMTTLRRIWRALKPVAPMSLPERAIALLPAAVLLVAGVGLLAVTYWMLAPALRSGLGHP
jgi:hypothetical protein